KAASPSLADRWETTSSRSGRHSTAWAGGIVVEVIAGAMRSRCGRHPSSPGRLERCVYGRGPTFHLLDRWRLPGTGDTVKPWADAGGVRVLLASEGADGDSGGRGLGRDRRFRPSRVPVPVEARTARLPPTRNRRTRSRPGGTPHGLGDGRNGVPGGLSE